MFKKFFRSVRKAAKQIAPIAAPIAGAYFGPLAGAGIGALLGQYGGKEGALKAAMLGGIGGVASNVGLGQNAFTGGGIKASGLGLKEGAKAMFLGRTPTGNIANVPGADIYRSTKTGGIFDVLSKVPGKGLLLGSTMYSLLNPPEENDFTPQPEPEAEGFKDLDVADIQYTDKDLDKIIVNPVYVAEGGIMSLEKGGTVDDYGGIEAFNRKNGEIAGPGTMTSDDIPAMLSDGEFVTKAVSVLGAGVKHGGAKTKEEARKKGAKFFYEQQKELEPFGKKVL